MKKKLMILILLGLPLLCQAQDGLDRIVKQRFQKIDYVHFDVALATEMNRNIYLGPRIGVGIGTYRNLINARVEIGYLFGNHLFQGSKDHISSQRLDMGASLDFNIHRWDNATVYIGGSAAWRWATTDKYCFANSTSETDKNLGHDHATLSAHVGIKLGERWSALIGYAYDLSPNYSQQYIYEHPTYDYYAVKKSVFERGRICIAIHYQIPF